MNYSIHQAKDELNEKIKTFDADSKQLLMLAIKALDKSGDDSADVSKQLEELLSNSSSLDSSIINVWAENVYIASLAMKRREDCEKELTKRPKEKIDGETAQWITTVLQGAIGIASVVFTVLFALGIIPNVFGVLGESQNTDAFYYIIGTIGQQAIALIIAIVIGLINHCRRKKKYKNVAFTFEELLAVKYADKPNRLWLLSSAAKKIRDSQIATGDNNRQSQGNRGKAKSGGKVYQNAGDVKEK